MMHSYKNYLATLALVLVTAAFNSCTNKIANDNVIGGEEGYSEQDGRWITYYWYCYKDGEKLPFELHLHLGYDFYAMQERYKRLNHEHTYPSKVKNDPYIDVIRVVANVLIEKADDKGVSPVALALSFVQSLPYQSGMGYYQRWGSECLIDRRGDCSDCSVLFAALVAAMGYDCVFLEYPTHLMVGVWATPRKGDFYTHRNKHFYMCETTGWGFAIGENPKDKYNKATIIDL